MIPDYWRKQSYNEPLFPGILWARPENRLGAGKLLILGGNTMGFAAVGEAFQAADKAGAGSIRAILPDSLRKTVGPLIEADFVPSTPSGSLASKALGELLPHTGWADMVLLAGDIGRNSETAVLLEKFTQKYPGPLAITKDVVDYFYSTPGLILDRPDTLIVLSLAQLQKLGVGAKFKTPFLLSLGLMLLAQALHDFTLEHQATIVTKELDNIVVAKNGQVISTKLPADKDIWRVQTAAAAAVLWMQNPSKPLEAIASSLVINTN